MGNPDGTVDPAYWHGHSIVDVGYGAPTPPRVVRRYDAAEGYAVPPITSTCGIGEGAPRPVDLLIGTTARAEPGDSGGPLLGDYPADSAHPAGPRVIGMHWLGGTASGSLSSSAVHGDWVNAVRQLLDPDGDGYQKGELDAHVPGNIDADGDGLSESNASGVDTNNDNCDPAQSLGDASTANPDQLDSDGDGLGDVCDLCPVVYDPGQESCVDRSTGERVGLNCAVSDRDGDTVPDRCDNCPDEENATQTDTNPDTPAGDICDDDDDDDVPNHLDNCPAVRNVDQSANCNEDTETVVRGDACDTNPCPVTNDRSREVLAGADSVLFANDVIDGFGVAGVEPDVFVGEGTGATAFRWCPCSQATDDSVQSRLLCDNADVGCRRFADARASEGSSWRPMRMTFGSRERFDAGELVLDYTDPARALDPAFSSSRSFEAVWDFVSDGSDLDVIETDVRGHESLRAVVWARATRYLPTPPSIPGRDVFTPLGCSASGTCPAVVPEDPASGFWSGRVERREARRPDPDPPPFVHVLIPREHCAICISAFPRGYLPMPQCLVDGCDDPEVWIRVAGGDLDVTPAFSTAARAAMLHSEWQWVSPAEPPEVLTSGAARLVAWDPAARQVRQTLVVRNGIVELLAQGPQGPPPDGPPIGLRAASAGVTPIASARTPLLRGNLGTLVLLGSGDDRAASSTVDLVSLASGSAHGISLRGEGPRRVLAAQLAAREQAALVLDESRGHGPHRARLLWVDLDRRESSVVAAFPRLGVFDRYGIAATPDGDFVLVASSAALRRHVVLQLRANATGVAVLRWTSGAGTLAGAVQASRAGISLPVHAGRSSPWTVIGYRMTDLRSADIRRLRDCL